MVFGPNGLITAKFRDWPEPSDVTDVTFQTSTDADVYADVSFQTSADMNADFIFQTSMDMDADVYVFH